MRSTATNPAVPVIKQKPQRKRRNKYLRSWNVIIGSTIIVLLLLTAVFANLLTPMDPLEQSMWDRYVPPQGFIVDGEWNTRYVLGADELGRDVLSRIIVGSRISLVVGLIATGLSLIAGVLLGATAGYAGGAVDAIIMRAMDLLLALPAILLAIAIVAVFGPNIVNTMLAIAVVRVPLMARVVRSEILRIKQEQYVEATISLGAQHLRVLFVHILRNAWAPVMVLATLGMGTAIVTEASLSFLGLGAQPPQISWGRMLAVGRDAIRSAPHVTLFPGVAITLVVLGFSLLGDGLRDVLDTRLKDR